jgi:hypothetical protein
VGGIRRSYRRRRIMTRNEYVFIEEWFVPASIEDVWEVLADGKRLPL